MFLCKENKTNVGIIHLYDMEIEATVAQWQSTKRETENTTVLGSIPTW